MNEILTQQIASTIIQSVGNQFDSRDFIIQLIINVPSVYGRLLIKHDSVTTAHAEIANYLRHHAKNLYIRKIEDEAYKSYDILGHLVPCARWEKTNILE